MASEAEIEKEIQEKGLTAPRLTPEDIDAKIKEVTYTKLPSGKAMVCEITLENGYTVRGESACVSPENFNQEIGENHLFSSNSNKKQKLNYKKSFLLYELFLGRDHFDL